MSITTRADKEHYEGEIQLNSIYITDNNKNFTTPIMIRIQFGVEKNSLHYKVEGVRILNFTINNKFYSQGMIGLKNELLMLKSSSLNIDCIAVDSGDLDILQSLAISSAPIICSITLESGDKIIGNFFLSHYSRDNSTGKTPEIVFKLKGSGDYEIR